MRIDSIEARPRAIPFKVAFKHASAERRETQSLWVEARSGDRLGIGEGCPREYVTRETVGGALARMSELGMAMGTLALLAEVVVRTRPLPQHEQWVKGETDPFALAHARVYGDRALARSFLAAMAHHIADYGVGSIAEIFAGHADHSIGCEIGVSCTIIFS